MNFEESIVNLYGNDGQKWLNQLTEITNNLCEKWNLTHPNVLPNLSYNYVMSCLHKGEPVVLKISFSKQDVIREINTLQAFAKHGCVKLLNHDTELGAILLEKIIPGTSLKTLFPESDDHATQIICDRIKALHKATYDSSKFRNLSDWLKILEKDWSIPQQYLLKARILKNQLLQTTMQQVLLHADLHHENILLGNTGWKTIDPKGIIGDPVFETGAAIKNPIPDILKMHNAKEIIRNRINLFATTLHFDEKRIYDWSYVQAVLSACWAIEDNLDSTYFIDLAKILEEL